MVTGNSPGTECGPQVPRPAQVAGNPSSFPDLSNLGRYQHFLFPSISGGYLGVTAPTVLWSLFASGLIWVVIGLLALRFDVSETLNPVDMLISQLVVFAMSMSVAINTVVTHYMREKGGQIWKIMPLIPVASALSLCGGLLILIWEIWSDGPGGLDEKIMFMLIGLGSCLTHIGLLSLADVGRAVIYRVPRWVAIALTAIIAFEVLDALWITTTGITGEGFSRAFWQALIVCVSYLVMIAFMAQAKSKGARNAVLIAYFCLGVVGFLTAVWLLWGAFDAGIARFIYGAVIVVAVTSIGLLLIHYFHANPPAVPQTSESSGLNRGEEDAVTGQGETMEDGRGGE